MTQDSKKGQNIYRILPKNLFFRKFSEIDLKQRLARINTDSFMKSE